MEEPVGIRLRDLAASSIFSKCFDMGIRQEGKCF